LIKGKRSRLIIIAAAGTLTLATAISAAAATLPTGFAATADAHMMTAQWRPDAAQDSMTSAQGLAAFDSMRYGLGQRTAAYESATANTAAAKAAAAKAAAAKAAAAKAAAAKVAAAKAAAAKAAAAKAAAQQPAPQQQATQQQAAQQPAATAPSGSPQQIAQQMLSQFGWSSGQFACLQPLWQQESGWNIYASNPSTGAYGIPQALPGSKMASAGPDWESNAATQIRWGLTYIQGLYGSPCGAWAHEEADGWY